MKLDSCITYAAGIDIRQAAKYNDDQQLPKQLEFTTLGLFQNSKQ